MGERVYPLTLPQGVTLPAVDVPGISDIPRSRHSTAQDHPACTGVERTVSRVQFSCYGTTYDEAEALADELASLAVGYRGTWGDVEVDSVIPDLRIDDWDRGPGRLARHPGPHRRPPHGRGQLGRSQDHVRRRRRDRRDHHHRRHVPIEEVRDITGLEFTTDEVDVTNHDSPGFGEEVLPTIKRWGTISFPMNAVPGAAGQQALYDAWAARTIDNYVLTYTNGVVATFTGFVP